IGLFWEGKQFQRERVPSWALVHAPVAQDSDAAPRGESLVRAYRCLACHALPVLGTPLRAPSLRFLKGGVHPGWLVEYLHSPALGKNSVRMPDLGLGREEARDVAAFLWSATETAPLDGRATGRSAKGK